MAKYAASSSLVFLVARLGVLSPPLPETGLSSEQTATERANPAAAGICCQIYSKKYCPQSRLCCATFRFVAIIGH